MAQLTQQQGQHGLRDDEKLDAAFKQILEEKRYHEHIWPDVKLTEGQKFSKILSYVAPGRAQISEAQKRQIVAKFEEFKKQFLGANAPSNKDCSECCFEVKKGNEDKFVEQVLNYFKTNNKLLPTTPPTVEEGRVKMMLPHEQINNMMSHLRDPEKVKPEVYIEHIKSPFITGVGTEGDVAMSPKGITHTEIQNKTVDLIAEFMANKKDAEHEFNQVTFEEFVTEKLKMLNDDKESTENEKQIVSAIVKNMNAKNASMQNSKDETLQGAWQRYLIETLRQDDRNVDDNQYYSAISQLKYYPENIQFKVYADKDGATDIAFRIKTPQYKCTRNEEDHEVGFSIIKRIDFRNMKDMPGRLKKEDVDKVKGAKAKTKAREENKDEDPSMGQPISKTSDEEFEQLKPKSNGNALLNLILKFLSSNGKDAVDKPNTWEKVSGEQNLVMRQLLFMLRGCRDKSLAQTQVQTETAQASR